MKGALMDKMCIRDRHKLNRLENRKKYLEKGERQKRTHRLCNLGGTIESLAQIAKAVGVLGAFAFLQILLSILQTLQLVLFLCKMCIRDRVSGVSLSSMTSTRSRSASASISRGLTVSPKPSSAV